MWTEEKVRRRNALARLGHHLLREACNRYEWGEMDEGDDDTKVIARQLGLIDWVPYDPGVDDGQLGEFLLLDPGQYHYRWEAWVTHPDASLGNLAVKELEHRRSLKEKS